MHEGVQKQKGFSSEEIKWSLERFKQTSPGGKSPFTLIRDCAKLGAEAIYMMDNPREGISPVAYEADMKKVVDGKLDEYDKLKKQGKGIPDLKY